MKRVLRWSARGVALIVAAITLLAGVVALLGWRSLPTLAGVARVPGIARDVEIVRDAHAVPHIFARSAADAYFGLGYVHAQDRLWQLEFNRRVGSGTLSALIGERGLPIDRLFRTLGLRHVAERNYEALDPETREAVAAYARGVNAWLGEGHPLPPELRVLGATPAAWRPADSVMFLKLMAWQLSGNWSDELWRVRLGAQLDARQLAEFAPGYAGEPGISFSELWRTYDQLGLPLGSTRNEKHTQRGAGARWPAALAPIAAQLAPLAPADHGQAIGSNNWVVDGTRSASGKPLLANDPHLALSAPSQWYFAHLEAPGLSVVGATLPSLPGVILGRTQQVAWAFTNMHPDTEDVYLERLVAGDDERYVTPEGTRAFAHSDEIIEVKDAPDVTLRVRRTRHGPVLSDVSEEARQALPKGHVLTLRWTGLQTDDETLAFPVRAARARDAAGLREAARAFHAPAQNIVFADVHGSVGSVSAGRIPTRAPDNALKGLVPSPGWVATYDWTGFVPFEALPQHTTAETRGRIVTANQRTAPADYPHFLGADWGPPYRHDRIATLLDQRADHTLDSFARIQRDQRSTVADKLLPAMLAALGEPGDPGLRAEASALAGWDREMRAEAREPLIFSAWLRELSRQIYADELGPLFVDAWAARPEFVEAVLRDRAGQGRWCDDRRSEAVEGCATLAETSLTRALAYLETRFGTARDAWSWGVAHPSVASHALIGKVPVLSRWFNLSGPRGGDSSTVDVGSYAVDDDDTAFRNAWGPGFRALYDLSDLERSRAILNSGQSGHVLSPHYRDMSALWRDGQYVPLITDRRRIERGALGHLTLQAF